MSTPATPATKVTKVTKVNAENIQGDVLSGLPKKTQTFMFFKITDGKKFVTDLVNLAPLIQTVAQSLADRDAIAKHKKEKKGGLVKLAGANISLTITGLRAMGISDAEMQNTSLVEPVFQGGALADAQNNLKDPKTPSGQVDWEPEFLNPIDGLILVAGDSHDTVNKKIAEIQKIFPADPNHSSITIVKTIVGDVRPGPEDGHEHFGFLDGVSNPLIAGFDPVVPGPAPIDASNTLTGYKNSSAPDWTQDGSFLVFRYLFQKVPEFNAFLQQNALKNDPISGQSFEGTAGADLLGARIVGRWKSGAPVDITPFQDNIALANDKVHRNNFEFTDEFRDNNKCPWAGHIRRTNPRADIRQAPIAPRRIMRRGIAFGPEVTPAEQASNTTQEERGLLFACYQADISAAFQFIQKNWSNNPNFPFFPADPSPGFTPGLDPLIGQADAGKPRTMTGYDPLTANDPEQKPLTVPTIIVPRGAGYFFVPSITLLSQFSKHITST